MFRCTLIMLCISPTVLAYPGVHHNHHSILNDALKTGVEINGNSLYLCTGSLFNSIQPGKTWSGYGKCNIPYGGKEYVLTQYSVPNRKSFGQLVWDRAAHHPLVIGKDTNGNALYLCQSNFNGSMQPGKTWPGYNHCNISYAGREVILNDYRVLNTHNEIVVPSRAPQNQHSHY